MKHLVFAATQRDFLNYVTSQDPRPSAQFLNSPEAIAGWVPPFTLVFLQGWHRHPNYIELRKALARILP